MKTTVYRKLNSRFNFSGICLICVSLFVLLLSGCIQRVNSDTVSIVDGVTIIDVDKAAQDVRDFPLSELVDHVEILELESTAESNFNASRSIMVGTQYVMVTDDERQLVLIFERSGEFVRTIGKVGKGPGEYVMANFATLDPKEESVIVHDVFSKKLVRYSIEGSFMSETSYKEDCNEWASQMPFMFIDDKHFAISIDRPYKETDDYYRVLVFDLNLNLVKKMLPLPMNDSLGLFNIGYRSLEKGVEGSIYWETYTDTLYKISKDLEAEPAYYFSIKKNKASAKLMKDREAWEEVQASSQILGINDLNRYLLGWSQFETSCWLIYDKKKKEAFVAADGMDCKNPSNSWITAWIDNDVYGFDPVFFQVYQADNKIAVTVMNIDYAQKMYDLGCLSKRAVTQPEVRDRLVEIITNYSGEELPVVLIMHLK